jgi:sulfate permease, SulP family
VSARSEGGHIPPPQRGDVLGVLDRLLPISSDLFPYERSWMPGDLAAAITVWAILVPESMAYASVAGMPPETGLYAATIPLLAYALFGSSRRITVGPSAAIAALSFATVAPFAETGTEEFIGLTVLLALFTGVLLIIAGMARLGVIADFLSEPVLKGFLVGVALTITLGQLGKLFRLETEGEGFFVEAWDLLTQLPELHLPTLVVGAACLISLFALERFIPRVPAALVVVVGSIAAVNLFDLVDAGLLVAGEVPSGLPSIGLPAIDWTVAVGLVPGAIGLAVVVYGETMALSKTFSGKHGERVDANQELVALGVANAAGGLFGAFATNGSNSRSAAADASGQKTQVSSLIVFLLLILTLLFLTGLFADLPEAALGAIVIHAVTGLIRFGPISALRKRNTVDFWAAVATLLGVLVLDVLAGLLIGVVVSLAGLMDRAVRPRITWLGREAVTGRFIDRRDEAAVDLGTVSVVAVGAELFFANVGAFRDAVLAEVESRSPRVVVLDAEAVSDIDTTAADEIVKLRDELAARHVLLAFARLAPAARSALESAGLDLHGMDYFRVADAVDRHSR